MLAAISEEGAISSDTLWDDARQLGVRRAPSRRLGVMFFNDPTAALANVHQAMKPEGRLALAVFRPASENPWPTAPFEAVRHLQPPIPPSRPEEPGMFSWRSSPRPADTRGRRVS
jgi:hypothetical protein